MKHERAGKKLFSEFICRVRSAEQINSMSGFVFLYLKLTLIVKIYKEARADSPRRRASQPIRRATAAYAEAARGAEKSLAADRSAARGGQTSSD